MKIRQAAFAATVILLSGCATSTGVVPMGQDTHMVSRRDNGPMASLGDLKAAVLKDAKDYCAAEKKDFQVMNTHDVSRSFGRLPEASIQFRCVPK